MNSRTDQELLHDFAKRNSETAFAELVHRHVDLVYSAALRMVRGQHLAEDVTQGVFVALARSARQLTDCAVLSGWLYRTAQNLAANAVRSEVRRHSREQEAAAMNELRSAEPDIVWEQVTPHLDAALRELNDADRDSILLRFFERKSAREIGERLGLGEEAAQKRVSRALDKLRDQLVRRGVTSTAAALGVALTGNAVSAAPAAFAATLASVSLASAATGTGTSFTLFKLIAMTKLQAGIVGAIVIASVATPLVLQHRALARLHDQDLALRQRASQLATLRAENEQLSNLPIQVKSSSPLPNDQSLELLGLRGEVTRLRVKVQEMTQPETAAALSRTDMLASMASLYSERVSQFRQLLQSNPSEQIPELQFLADKDWLWLANRERLDTDISQRQAMSTARQMAQENFVSEVLKPALQQYGRDNDGQFPTEVAQLKAYSKSNIDDTILQRWEILRRNNLVRELQGQLPEDWFITQKGPVNAELDQRIILGLTNVTSFASGPTNRWVVLL